MKQYKGYLFDIDGTILLGNTLIPGAKEKMGKKVYIVGTEEYKNLYRDKGINVIDNILNFNSHDIDVFIIALDIELDLKKLEIACKLLKKY